MITSFATYDADFAAARALLADRIEAAKAEDGIGRYIAEQIDHWADDALNNEWIEGITVADWAERTARRVSL